MDLILWAIIGLLAIAATGLMWLRDIYKRRR